MKIFRYICLAFIAVRIASAQDSMTQEQFKQLIALPGDTNALRPELASLPLWKNALCHVTLKYQDGKVIKEDCIRTARTVEGKYIVFTIDSKLTNQMVYSITGYDEKASALRTWGLFEEKLIEATIVFDSENKTSASTSTYADGFMELSVGSYSSKEILDHALVYKDGVLFMTRDVKTQRLPNTNSISR